VTPAPFDQVRSWLDHAQTSGLLGWDTAIVATATPDGRPSARAVLLRGFDDRGFVFFTDTRSRKGRELAANPRAALVMTWAPMERQIRAEGPVEFVSPEESDAYFARRPRGHQLGAWASRQSQVLGHRSELEQRLAEVQQEFEGRDVPRPPYWGGYRLIPDEIELWEGRPDRLHHRARYRRGPDGWRADFLWP
jgi:pyridoxamine 5'-phosphate oxidase